jgi:hypothetical protein
MKCHEERRLAAHLANAAGATQTQATIEDKDKGFEEILKSAANECRERGGVNALIDTLLQGPPRWAYAALRYLPDVGSRRDELVKKAAGDPSSAFHTLRHVADVGSNRDLLLQKAAEDPGWANMTLRTVSDLGSHRNLLLAAVEAPPPVEIGSGYNTYFVNQTGADLWAMWNTGENGSTGSLSDPVHFNKGQNVGYGRGGACISEVRVFNHEPQGQNNPQKWGDQGYGWNHNNIDGCLSWGFRITAGSSTLVFAEVYAWAEGQPGMPGQYPPSNGS